jgi:hypothetical protein
MKMMMKMMILQLPSYLLLDDSLQAAVSETSLQTNSNCVYYMQHFIYHKIRTTKNTWWKWNYIYLRMMMMILLRRKRLKWCCSHVNWKQISTMSTSNCHYSQQATAWNTNLQPYTNSFYNHFNKPLFLDLIESISHN